MAKETIVYRHIYKPEEDKLVVTGSLTAFRCGTSKWEKETEKYYIYVRTCIPVNVREDIAGKYFADSKEKYIPEPFKDLDKAQDTDEIYLNLKSLYEIPAFVQGKGNQRYSFDDVLELGDGLPPLGSTVELACRLKEGAIYPIGVRFVEIRKQNVDDYFS